MKPTILLLLGFVLASPAWANPLPPSKERKLLELESRVAALESKAFQLKQKIQNISDKIFNKKFTKGQPKVIIQHTNKMAGFFHITELTYSLVHKGQSRQLSQRKTTVRQKLPNQLRVYKGGLVRGRYTLKVKAKVRGYNPVLTYINNYKLTLANQLPFRANPGRTTTIFVEFRDNGNKNVSSRLSIIFRIKR